VPDALVLGMAEGAEDALGMTPDCNVTTAVGTTGVEAVAIILVMVCAFELASVVVRVSVKV
jgi:hypothetical protein